MMGERRIRQEALFYEFSLERHVPEKHLLRSIDRFVELDGLRQELAPFYSEIGRPSVDPDLLIRMLIVGYCFGIARSGGYAKRYASTWRIAGFADWVSTVKCPIIRPSRRTGTAASATATCCAGCLRPCCGAASPKAGRRRRLCRGRQF